ncbi:hypothetical protein MUN77_01670 [Leucobacter allii]|uniref:hypothetical protein n=1 Tax=Leucobacter allii TaxID=2932247 RepID=UPI001FCFAD9F|nr:hypothetical protein [Leucobacter allii]UOR02068.1 hypothetical protein MUN77_01670 [Leucobacter allii]
MSDFSITSTTLDNPVDTRWRASHHGQFTAQPGTLDLTTFVAGTHYNIGARTDFVIPSGVAVQYNETSKMYEPWDPAAGTVAPIAGYINDNQGVSVKRADGTTATKGAFARLLHGILDAQYLPVAAQKAAVKTAETTAQISFI